LKNLIWLIISGIEEILNLQMIFERGSFQLIIWTKSYDIHGQIEPDFTVRQHWKVFQRSQSSYLIIT